MPRLIDADRIVYSWIIDNDGKEHDGVTLQSIIDKMPTVDAEPVHHGRWLDVLVADDEGETDGVECSVCGYTDINVYWAKTYHRFCPNCGAKMDGERREDGNNDRN